MYRPQLCFVTTRNRPNPLRVGFTYVFFIWPPQSNPRSTAFGWLRTILGTCIWSARPQFLQQTTIFGQLVAERGNSARHGTFFPLLLTEPGSSRNRELPLPPFNQLPTMFHNHEAVPREPTGSVEVGFDNGEAGGIFNDVRF